MKWWCEKLHGSTNAFQSFPVIKPTQIHVGHVEHIHHQSHHDFLGSHPDPDPCFCWWCWCQACLFALGSPAEKINSLKKKKLYNETLQNIFISNTTKYFHSNAPRLSDLIITSGYSWSNFANAFAKAHCILIYCINYWKPQCISYNPGFFLISQLRLIAILAPKHLKSFCAA